MCVYGVMGNIVFEGCVCVRTEWYFCCLVSIMWLLKIAVCVKCGWTETDELKQINTSSLHFTQTFKKDRDMFYVGNSPGEQILPCTPVTRETGEKTAIWVGLLTPFCPYPNRPAPVPCTHPQWERQLEPQRWTEVLNLSTCAYQFQGLDQGLKTTVLNDLPR